MPWPLGYKDSWDVKNINDLYAESTELKIILNKWILKQPNSIIM